MSIASDISNLLARFGANADGYLEVENTIKYKELPKAAVTEPAALIDAKSGMPAAEVAPIVEQEVVEPVGATVADSLHSESARIEPVIIALPELPDTHATTPPASAAIVASAPAATASSSSLRALLAEVALNRESQACVHNAVETFHTLNIEKPVTPAKVIAVTSPKGGVGKTTLCAALAGVISDKGRVIAIDLDPQNALQYHLGVDQLTAGPADATLAGDRWSSSLRRAAGTYVLPYEAIAADAPRILEQHLQTERHWLAQQLARMNLGADDVVILDVPGGNAAYLEQALDAADQVLVVLTPDAGSFMALDHMSDLFDGHGDCVYVVNQFDASRTFCQDMLEVLKRRFGSQLIGVVPLDHAISEGWAYGVNVLLDGGKSPAQGNIRAIGQMLQAQTGSREPAGVGHD
jgi:cellulose synthase operon protein YhjQ